MTLSSSNHPEPTKKTIEAEDIGGYQPMTHNHRKYTFFLPPTTDLPTLTTQLTARFTHSLLHASEDPHGAQLLLQGLPPQGFTTMLAKILDHCLFCWSKGLPQGRLAETYQVIPITLKREVTLIPGSLSITAAC